MDMDCPLSHLQLIIFQLK
uniref:Uncharacterized protein n=1 Tax=Anguilla anguilla TaxID=7936 RepID=A0A0E9TDR9_ANGAN